MCTTGVVKWFDRSRGIGEVTLDGGECVAVRRAAPGTLPPVADPADTHGSDAARACDPRLDVAAALRAGTWGDGGRDY